MTQDGITLKACLWFLVPNSLKIVIEERGTGMEVNLQNKLGSGIMSWKRIWVSIAAGDTD